MTLTKEHISIMERARDRAAGGYYCGDSAEMQELVADLDTGPDCLTCFGCGTVLRRKSWGEYTSSMACPDCAGTGKA